MFKIGKINTIQLEYLIKKAKPIIDNASSFLANELKKYVKPYTPYREGGLERSLKFIRKDGRVVGLVYDIEYASKMYHGDPNWNYTKRINPQARPRWVESAWQIHHTEILNNVNKALKNV